MPTNFATAEATSVEEAFGKALELLKPWKQKEDPYVWFRGIRDRSHDLLPGAYWRAGYDESDPLVSFAQEGVQFADIKSFNTWETYYLAQHHGIPTRLLDWSESFMAALFFALDEWNEVSTPCIWMLQPNLLNKTFMGWEGVLSPENFSHTDGWLPLQVSESASSPIIKPGDDGCIYNNATPIAIYPRRGNRRIAAQRGTFTVHGTDRRPIDALLTERTTDLSTIMARLDLPISSKTDAMSQLSLLGARRSSIYPDLDNFVKELKEFYKW